MTEQMPGQLSLFEGPYEIRTVTVYATWLSADDQVCEQCGTYCTSSKECVEISGLDEQE